MTAAPGAVPVSTQPVVIIFPWFVVIGMTACTGPGIGREWPGHSFTVAGVAVLTRQVRPVIPRIVTGCMTIIYHGQPTIGGMAGITLLGGDKMSLRRTCGRRAIVAAVTVACHTTVIKGHAEPVTGRGMTVITLSRSRQMAGRLTRGKCAVMAVRTGTRHIGVTEGHIQPVIG